MDVRDLQPGKKQMMAGSFRIDVFFSKKFTRVKMMIGGIQNRIQFTNVDNKKDRPCE